MESSRRLPNSPSSCPVQQPSIESLPSHTGPNIQPLQPCSACRRIPPMSLVPSPHPSINAIATSCLIFWALILPRTLPNQEILWLGSSILQWDLQQEQVQSIKTPPLPVEGMSRSPRRSPFVLNPSPSLQMNVHTSNGSVRHFCFSQFHRF